MNSASMVCPKCRVGITQLTSFKMGHYCNESMNAYHCSKCDYGYWVPMVPKNVVISTKGTYQEEKMENSYSGDSLSDIDDFLEQLRFLWKEYVLCDENELTEDAKALRAELLNCVKKSK